MISAVAPPARFPWPPLICAAAIAASAILNIVYPLPWITEPLSDMLFAGGWLLVAATIAIDVSAMRTMKAAKTTIMPHRASDHLVTSGPFSFSRNPIYLGYALLLIGIALITEIAWFIPFTVVSSFLIQKLAIEPEERHLELRFGKKYRDYAKRVRRWI